MDAAQAPAPARSIDWPLWLALPLSLVAFFSYPFFFVRFPVTRDVPWATFLLFVVSDMLAAYGLLGAFRSGRTKTKISAVVVTLLSALVFTFFLFGFFVFAKQLPTSAKAPRVGQPAPDFSLPDTTGQTVSLADLRSKPLPSGAAPKGVLLIFYRGYW